MVIQLDEAVGKTEVSVLLEAARLLTLGDAREEQAARLKHGERHEPVERRERCFARVRGHRIDGRTTAATLMLDARQDLLSHDPLPARS